MVQGGAYKTLREYSSFASQLIHHKVSPNQWYGPELWFYMFTQVFKGKRKIFVVCLKVKSIYSAGKSIIKLRPNLQVEAQIAMPMNYMRLNVGNF